MKNDRGYVDNDALAPRAGRHYRLPDGAAMAGRLDAHRSMGDAAWRVGWRRGREGGKCGRAARSGRGAGRQSATAVRSGRPTRPFAPVGTTRGERDVTEPLSGFTNTREPSSDT